MARRGASFQPGLDVQRTITNVDTALAPLLDELSLEAALEAHRLIHEHSVDDDRSTFLRRIAGCRLCSLGYALVRLHAFETADVPGLQRAAQLRELEKHWKQFREVAVEIEPEHLQSYEVRAAIAAIDRWQARLAWPIEDIPVAVVALSSRGRTSEVLVRDVLTLFLNGSIKWSEIVALVEDGRDLRVREQRLRQLTRSEPGTVADEATSCE